MVRFPLEGSKNEKLSSQNGLSFKNGTYNIKPLNPPIAGEIPAEVEMEVNPGADPADLIYGASAIVTCFRLAGSGGIGYSQKYDNGTLKIVKGALPYQIPTLHDPEQKEKNYKIDDIAVENMKEILKKHDKIDWKNSGNNVLRSALGRFNRSYDETGQEDILLDLIICFEILFVGDECIICGNPPDKSKTIQNCIGHIISPENPQTIEREVWKAYHIRSAIVHGGERFDEAPRTRYRTNSKFRIRDMWQFVLKIRKYARQCLLHFYEKLQDEKLQAICIKKNPRLLFGELRKA